MGKSDILSLAGIVDLSVAIRWAASERLSSLTRRPSFFMASSNGDATGKNGRKCPGIKSKSSLETFWKWWHLVYKGEMGHGLDATTIRKIDDVSFLQYLLSWRGQA
jgi:hypothetical protein